MRFFSAFPQSKTPATSSRGGSRCRCALSRHRLLRPHTVRPLRGAGPRLCPRGSSVAPQGDCQALFASSGYGCNQDFVFDPLHYLSLLEQKTNALDRRLPLAEILLPPKSAIFRRLLARMGKAGKREYVTGAAANRELLPRRCSSRHIGGGSAANRPSMAVKLPGACRIEKRPPRLNLLAHPYLPRAEVATTSARRTWGLKGAAP